MDGIFAARAHQTSSRRAGNQRRNGFQRQRMRKSCWAAATKKKDYGRQRVWRQRHQRERKSAGLRGARAKSRRESAAKKRKQKRQHGSIASVSSASIAYENVGKTLRALLASAASMEARRRVRK